MSVSWCLSHSIKRIYLNICCGIDVVLVSCPILMVSPEAVLRGKETPESDVVAGRECDNSLEEWGHFAVNRGWIGKHCN